MGSKENSLGRSLTTFMPEDLTDLWWQKEILRMEADCSRWPNFPCIEELDAKNKLLTDWLAEHTRLAKETIAAEARGNRALATFWFQQKQIYLKTHPLFLDLD